MTQPLTAPDLVGRGEPTKPFLVVDPGKRTGVLHYTPAGWLSIASNPEPWLRVNTAELDELPSVLWGAGDIGFVVCEDFKLRSGPHAGDAQMAAPQGIGMCRMACYAAGVPLFLVPPICKRAGRMALDAAGLEARERCRNDHERDVVDITGFVLREMRRCR